MSQDNLKAFTRDDYANVHPGQLYVDREGKLPSSQQCKNKFYLVHSIDVYAVYLDKDRFSKEFYQKIKSATCVRVSMWSYYEQRGWGAGMLKGGVGLPYLLDADDFKHLELVGGLPIPEGFEG